jgi:hypothetical protein
VAAAGAGLLAPAAGASAAGTAGFPDGATLIVAGLGGGPLDAWAEWLAPALSQALPPGTTLRKDVVGGADGVTGANQFEALTVPDGSTALLLPGRAAMAWLVGDPRARFDAARWVPALAAVAPGVLMSRVTAAQLQDGAELRIAVSDPAGPELPALLALDMLGARWRPVFGLSEALAFEALGQHEVDAVYLSGRRVAPMAEALAAAGAQHLFALSNLDEGATRRSDALAEVPDVTELLAGRTVDAGLRRALRATSAASELDMALVLPQLTPAAMVALWRRACAQAAGSDAVQVQATAQGVRPLPTPAATASTAAVLADTATLLALRQWLAVRLNYRPS